VLCTHELKIMIAGSQKRDRN